MQTGFFVYRASRVGVKPRQPAYPGKVAERCGLSGNKRDLTRDAPFDLLREETTMNDILKKQLEKAMREATKIIEDPDFHIGYDWEASLEEIRTAKARRRGELPGQPTAKVLAFPKQKSNTDDGA